MTQKKQCSKTTAHTAHTWNPGYSSSMYRCVGVSDTYSGSSITYYNPAAQMPMYVESDRTGSTSSSDCSSTSYSDSSYSDSGSSSSGCE